MPVIARFQVVPSERGMPLGATGMMNVKTAQEHALLPGSTVLEHPLRVMAVDDRVDVARSLAMLLKYMGHQVQVAYGATTALQQGNAFHPDVVFLDIGLPDRSGHDVCMEMRRTGWGTKAYIVALTGHNEPSDMIRSAHTGFDRHVGKPMEFSTLREIMGAAENKAACDPAQ